jgi:hypothetical protein
MEMDIPAMGGNEKRGNAGEAEAEAGIGALRTFR